MIGVFEEVKFTGTPAEVSEQWRAARLRGIGGSDVAALMGFSKFRSPYSVWAEKTGRVSAPDLSNNQAVEWGNRLESVVADKFAENHPDMNVYEPGAMFVSCERPWAFANLDRIAEDDQGRKFVLECKTAGQWRADDWEGGVPDYYLTQVTHYLDVTQYEGAFVAVLIAGQDYREFYVPKDAEDLEAVRSAVDAFWNDNVLNDEAPYFVGGKDEASTVLEANKAHDGEMRDATDAEAWRLSQIYAGIEAYSEAIKTSEARKKALETELKCIIGGSKGVFFTDEGAGRVSATWSRYMKRKTNMKKLKEENAELVARYSYEELTDGGIRFSKKKGSKNE